MKQDNEKVQKQAARFITVDYRTREEGCVTGMLQSLELSSLLKQAHIHVQDSRGVSAGYTS